MLLVATAGYPKDVKLSWDPSPTEGVVSYTLYWDNQPTPPFSNSIEAGNVLTFEIANLPDDEEHWFAVTASDGNGNESSYSNIVKSNKISTLPELDLDFRWEILH